MFHSFRRPVCEETFDSLFETYKERLFGYILAVAHSRYLAEEITQEIFLKLWLCRNELHRVENLESYLFAIARNKMLNHLRKANYDEKLIDELKSRMKPLSNDVEEQISLSESDRLVQEAITLLSPQRQLVYRLSRNQGLDHRQVADVLHIAHDAARKRYSRALAALEQRLRGRL